MSYPTGSLIFSGIEQTAWQVVSPTGVILGTPPFATPVDPNPPGCFAMFSLRDSRMVIAAATYFYIVDAGLTAVSGGIADELFTCGTSGRHAYRIANVPPSQVPILSEINVDTWAVTRTWILPGTVAQYAFSSLSIDPSETIAYYLGGPIVPYPAGLHRWDLTNNVQLSNLVSGATLISGLLTLPTGDIVVGWVSGGVKRYTAAGALVRTYAVSAFHMNGSIALGVSNSFWVESSSPTTGYSQMTEFEIDTGAILHQFDTPNNGVSWDGPYVVLGAIGPAPASFLLKADTDLDGIGGGGGGGGSTGYGGLGASDDGTTFQAYVKSRTFPPSGTLGRLGAVGQEQQPLVVARKSPATLALTIDRDRGRETQQSTASLAAVGTETRVIRKFEDAGLADAGLVQFQLGDSAATSNRWSLDRLHVRTTPEGDR